MTARGKDFDGALDRAAHHARVWLEDVGERPVPPRADADAVGRTLAGPLPDRGLAPDGVVDELASRVEPGLMAIGSGRFFGWVMGGTLPAALGADWLVSAWDQNAGMRFSTPGVVAVEEAAGRWVLDALGLPAGADVGFVTGATTASFTGLGAARGAVLARAGWDVHERGLVGGPPVRVLVGAERHDSVDLALRYLGLGTPTVVGADDQGRIRADALATALAAGAPGTPTIVVLQAGNVHSGSFDPFAETVALAHDHGAWVHVDGAFGLWAAAAPELAHLVRGMADADSWATDAHKTLNVPYDCGIAIVADPVPVRAAFGVHTAYLVDAPGPGNPYDKAPELSRRARGVPTWAALRSLGRDGLGGLVAGLAGHARAIAEGMSRIDGVRVVNDVVYTQVCLALADDARTRAAGQRLVADGDTWISGSRWQGRDVLRVSVSNWSTDDDDVARTVEAVRRAVRDPG
ncbi:pyridoxal-dependent decarboxylase [Isoptericola sp. 4D.3]|uniref:Pyridoxal-dependent decarboxylase n=1 Tax=Isoptericola peretonis TaxID=2918523 RepID=A0ABT0J1Q9_9MICO|nr:pyridoxal-dependent decarboxylase [Isoptericola sp. 4D.3]